MDYSINGQGAYIMSGVSWRPAGGPFTVHSYGNGLSYLITSDDVNGSAFFQGDDAREWREGYDKADETDQLLAYLRETWRDYAQPI